MDDELLTLRERKVYEPVRVQPNQKVIGCRWVFARKRNAQGSVVRHRARLVAKGFQQRPGWDYTEVYNPVVAFTLVRILFMVLVVLGGWLHCHLDVKCAYLYGTSTTQYAWSYPRGWRSNRAWRGFSRRHYTDCTSPVDAGGAPCSSNYDVMDLINSNRVSAYIAMGGRHL